MDIGDLISREQLDALTCTVQALSQVLAGFFFGVRLQLNDVKTLFLGAELLQTVDQ